MLSFCRIKHRVIKRDKINVFTLLILILVRSRFLRNNSKFLEKIYYEIEDKGKGLGTFLFKYIDTRNLIASKDELFSIIHQFTGMERKLKRYIENPSRHLTVNNLGKRGNIINISSEITKLDRDFLKQLLVSGRASESGKAVGVGEVFLAFLGEEGSKRLDKKGDVRLGDKSIEIKGTKGRLGEWNVNFVEIYKFLENKYSCKDLGINKRANLPSYISTFIEKYPEHTEQFEKFIKEELNLLDKSICFSKKGVEDFLLEWYVDGFLEGEANYADYIMIILEEEFRLFSRNDFKRAVLNREILFTNFSKSAANPQIVSFN